MSSFSFVRVFYYKLKTNRGVVMVKRKRERAFVVVWSVAVGAFVVQLFFRIIS